jgi:hypothetical protein
MSISKKKYKIIGTLAENAAAHCASLGIYENIITENNGNKRLATVLDVLRNGTITFVESNGKCYGITCWHVIESLECFLKQSGNKYSHSLFTMVNGFNCIVNTFINPTSNGMNTVIDIAIRELNPKLVEAIGKKPFNLDAKLEPKKIEFGYAVGFPETMRYKKQVEEGFIISMPQCEILAEINRIPSERFTLQNDFEEVPDITDFSGMSGGPIFWCDGENYGIYGIAYEAGTGGELTGDKGIFVHGHYATPKEIKHWISQIK